MLCLVHVYCCEREVAPIKQLEGVTWLIKPVLRHPCLLLLIWFTDMSASAGSVGKHAPLLASWPRTCRPRASCCCSCSTHEAFELQATTVVSRNQPLLLLAQLQPCRADDLHAAVAFADVLLHRLDVFNLGVHANLAVQQTAMTNQQFCLVMVGAWQGQQQAEQHHGMQVGLASLQLVMQRLMTYVQAVEAAGSHATHQHKA